MCLDVLAEPNRLRIGNREMLRLVVGDQERQDIESVGYYPRQLPELLHALQRHLVRRAE